MKELDSFTVEQLNELIESDHAQCGDVSALARIALAAKRAEPDYHIVRLERTDAWGAEVVLDAYETELDAIKSKADDGGEIIPVYTTARLNSPEIPDGWIKCSGQMPEVGDVVITAYQGCTKVGQMERAGKSYRYFTSITSGRELPATHWMPLPAAPEKPL
ncbi:DUF551 domain-containing protein [Yersinia kristensenii]|uniref:DUF551 domain-containing protein n=1 Tax=Yersinia kristensenii TaxID=28152 RepID=UPI0005DB9846|nr:DUF551 domain-containing protein [Yersinia kristensenii]CNG28464.1 Protein of uncharacterised function (DUF551) [Yersinia kristensenii]CNJ68497.1 Protein of uncharacterised function (DUF551) [Yersinia kristensenii]